MTKRLGEVMARALTSWQVWAALYFLGLLWVAVIQPALVVVRWVMA